MTTFSDSISKILEEIPALYRGPGGAVAVLKDGELVGQQVWGFADLERRIPMTADTIMPICSISKQMVCGLLTDLERNPTPAMIARGEEPAKQLSDQLGQVLNPKMLQDTGLTIRHLGNMQSGIRDYWAMTVLWGAKPEGHFSVADHGPLVMDRIKSFHFQPGTEYSYSNTNFFVLARVIEMVTQQPLEELLATRIFAPTGMATARLCAHTAEHPPPCVGYEGDERQGFYPAMNCIEWAGDAGIVASLTDMTAYEQFLDSSRTDPQGWYQSNSEQQQFKDGAPADYGYGLARQLVGGVTTVRHGGGLRGYRLSRLYAPEPRISIVVLLNQEHGDAGAISNYVLKRALAVPEAKHEVVHPSQDWAGTYLDPDTQIAITVAAGVAGELLVKYHRKAEKIRVVEPFRAQSDDMIATLEGNLLHVHVPKDNRNIHAQRVTSTKLAANPSNVHGHYYCAEVDSVFHCSGSGGMLYGSFDGFLGQGPVHLIRSLGDDVWALACPRAMDSQPPGDWTVVVRRDDSGNVTGVTIGCWLARNLEFNKTGDMNQHGTPHFGTHYSHYSRLAALCLNQLASNPDIFLPLAVNSRRLLRLHDESLDYFRNIDKVNFLEIYKQSSATFRAPNTTNDNMNTGHSGLNKFGSPEDDGYIKIVFYLGSILKKLARLRMEQKEQDEQDALKQHNTSNMIPVPDCRS